jgi:hypothetical protein
MTADVDALQIAARVCEVLESLGLPYSIGGSIASSFSGEPRSTLDIDIVVSLDNATVDRLVEQLEGEFYIDGEALRRAVHRRSTTNLIHRTTSLKVDLFIAGGSPLDDELLRRRITVAVGIEGVHLRIHTPEDILLQKLRWYRLGAEVSDRQWRDVLGIVRVQGPHLDQDYLSDGADRMGVVDLLERALREGRSPR